MLLDRVAHVTDEHLPLFTSDQLPEYRTALLHTYGVWYQPQRNGDRGRYPKPRLVPHPGLLYAQVVKVRQKGRVVEVRKKVVFGNSDVIDERLAESPVSNTVNTSFVERDNLTQRQCNRRLTRRTNGFSKELPWFEKQLWLSLAYYHLILPHHSLRQELETPEPTRGTGSPRRWRPRTPQQWLPASQTMSGQPLSCFPIVSQLGSWINCRKSCICFRLWTQMSIKGVEGQHRRLQWYCIWLAVVV